MKWLNGIVAGALAAIVAALVSLPLDSPDDLVFNTATVAIAALAAGIAAGAVWSAVESRRSRWQVYGGTVAAGFAIAVVAAVASEQALSGSTKFVLPLAAIALLIAAAVPPLLSTLTLPGRWQLAGAPVTLVVALGLGFGLAGMGDSPSGHLGLPNTTSTPQTGQVLTAADVAGRTFTVVPAQSKLTYTVREKLSILPNESDAVGSTTALSGTIALDGASQISVDLSKLESDQSRRDNYIRQNLFSSQPIATFVLESLGGLPESYTPGTTLTRTITARVTIRGVERDLPFDIEARVDGDSLQVVGRTDFTWADFDIPPPNTSIAQVTDNVHIEVLIVAQPDQPLGGA